MNKELLNKVGSVGQDSIEHTGQGVDVLEPLPLGLGGVNSLRALRRGSGGANGAGGDGTGGPDTPQAIIAQAKADARAFNDQKSEGR